MATGADALLRCVVFEGCITAPDSEIDRKPYHRNCRCALHDPKACSKASPCRRISYPLRRSWSTSCLISGSDESLHPPPLNSSSASSSNGDQD